jgi:hypothetical protein
VGWLSMSTTVSGVTFQRILESGANGKPTPREQHAGPGSDDRFDDDVGRNCASAFTRDGSFNLDGGLPSLQLQNSALPFAPDHRASRP